MKIRLALLVIFVLSGTPIVPSAAAGADRFALVIGNAKYPDAEAPLKEPINDAREVADELKRDGFNVEVGENLTGDAMQRAFERLYGRVKPGSVALIFFSGFGVQSSRQSYMIPVDAQIWTEADVRRDGFSLETVLGEINSRGAGVKIALIDNYKIPAANLVTAGYGKKGPKNPSDLYAAENRRVEIVNMAEREEASK